MKGCRVHAVCTRSQGCLPRSNLSAIPCRGRYVGAGGTAGPGPTCGVCGGTGSAAAACRTRPGPTSAAGGNAHQPGPSAIEPGSHQSRHRAGTLSGKTERDCLHPVPSANLDSNDNAQQGMGALGQAAEEGLGAAWRSVGKTRSNHIQTFSPAVEGASHESHSVRHCLGRVR